MLRRGNHMLLAVVLGLILGVVGRILLLQWADGVLAEKRPKAHRASASLEPAQFPRLAPSSRSARTRPSAPSSAPRPAVLVRRAA